jgi:hypothetical protein
MLRQLFVRRLGLAPSIVASSALFMTASTFAQVVRPDLNGDCTIDGGDWGILLGQWGSCSSPCSADFNGDMEVDGTDWAILLGYWNENCGPYEFHWNVGGGQASNITLDSGIDVAIQRDVNTFAQQFYGTFPADGLHLTFGSGGDYSDWYNFHGDFLDDHAAAIENFIAGEGLTSSYSGYAIIDYELWGPIWENNGGPTQTSWKACIEDINTPHWDNRFITTISYTPPTGITGYSGLSSTQKETFAKLSWVFFAKEFYELSLETGKAELPSASFGFYDFPLRRDWDGSQIGYPDAQKDLNDELDWLWAQVDVITPSIYPVFYAVTGTAGSYQITSEDNATSILENIEEAVRVRDNFASGSTKVLAFVLPYYTGPSRGTYYLQALNDINLDQQIRMPRYAGADGVIIWGYVTCNNSACSGCSSDANCVDSWEYEMNDRWEPIVIDLETDCS